MANIYQDIEDAVRAKLAADAWFGNAANVRTLQVDVPETPAPVIDYTDLFPDGALPAVAIIANIDESKVGTDVIGEQSFEVTVKVLGVVKNSRKYAARNAAHAMAWEIGRVLSACRDSQHSLALAGNGNFVKDITSAVDVRLAESKRRYYGLVEVNATVVAIRSY